MSKLLENDHNVYILGAGFSRDAGLPLINDFLLRMRDGHEWLQNCRRPEAQAVADVLEFRQKAAAAAYWVQLDLENIEELFSLASANAEDDITRQIRFAIAATLDYSYKTNGPLLQAMAVSNSNGLFDNGRGVRPGWISPSFMPAQISRHGSYEISLYTFYVARLLGMLKDSNVHGENTFITFNYDTLLEEALDDLNIGACYGSRLGNFPTAKALGSKQIDVFKLHGSINWARSKNGHLDVYRSYDELVAKDLIPELVPPTWKKIFENEIDGVWKDAVKKLSSATRIIVVGFSMPPTDAHFKYLMAAGIQNNLSLRQVLFVNPDSSDELERRVRHLMRGAYIDSRRIAFSKQTLNQFATDQSGFPDAYIKLSELGRENERGLQFSISNRHYP